jgi:outer membrane murein-binding lipoprotein Lpp
MRRVISVLAVLGLLLAGCASDPTASEEYQDLEQQLAKVEQILEDVTAERDALAATSNEPSHRYEKALATQEAIEDILHNPESYGSEDEVIELLASYATEYAFMDDAALGAAPITNAWYYTLYEGTMDAEIDNYYRWLSDDGSQGGFLWMWHGTNQAGNPFELPGIALDEYDENGLLAYEYVVYPYPDEYVVEAVTGSGTEQSSDSNPVESFDFDTDDLCTWVSAEEVGGFVEEAFGWEVIAVDLYIPPYSDSCQWKLTGIDGELGEVHAGVADWKTFEGTPYDLHRMMTQGVVDFAELDELPIGVSVSGHPSLREGVVVHNGGFGQFAFGVPPRDQYIEIGVAVRDEQDWEQFEPKFFAVANSMIEALGWLPDR